MKMRKLDHDMGELLTLAEFLDLFSHYVINDDDGTGYWATEFEEDIDSSVFEVKRPEWATHVMWYNK